MILCKFKTVLYYQCQITTATGSRHLPCQNRLPAGISCISQCLHLLRRDILTFHHTASRSSRFHRNHHQMVFQETESHLILRTLNLLRPEVVVIIMTHQTGNTDTDRILGTRDDTIVTLRIVLETENQSGEHLRIHLRQLHRPNLLNHLTGRGRKTTAVTHLKGWFQRDGNQTHLQRSPQTHPVSPYQE